MNTIFNQSQGLLSPELRKTSASAPLKRSDVPVEQTWDLTTVFVDDDAWEKAFSELKSKRGTFGAYQGQLKSSSETLLEAIHLKESVEMALGKLFVVCFPSER